MNAMVIPRVTSSETSRFIGLTMVCGAVLNVFFVTTVATIFRPLSLFKVEVKMLQRASYLESVSAALKQCRAGNLATMRGSVIWFALAVAWGLDCGLALFHHNWVQGSLTGFFACCFFAVGLSFRKRERKVLRRGVRQSR